MARSSPAVAKAKAKIARVFLTLAMAGGLTVAVQTWPSGPTMVVWVLMVAALCWCFWKIWNSSMCEALFCPNCDKHLPEDEEWRCGYCDTDNDGKKHPITTKCPRCMREPTSVVCDHCEATVFLTSDEDASHPARPVASLSKPAAPLIDEAAVLAREHRLEKLKIEQRLEIAELRKRLEQMEKTPEFKKKLSDMEQLQESFTRHEARALGADMVVEERRKYYAEKYKDDPEQLARATEFADEWRDSVR
jgi:hypothetical protein